MQTVIDNPLSNKPGQQSQDEDPQNLFDDLSMSQGNPFSNLELSSQNQQSQPVLENQSHSEKEEVPDFRQLMRLSKKEKKKEKKMRKIKQAKQCKKENRNLNIRQTQNSTSKPGRKMLMDSEEDQAEKQSISQQQKVKLNIRKSPKKVINNSDDQQKVASSHSDDSGEYSSENDASESDDLNKLDPENNEGSGKKTFKKKLGKKSRKQRILEKQGFDLRELGNDVQANFELNSSVGESDDSFSSGGRKKKGSKKVKKQKKEKKPKLTNEEFLGKLQEMAREDQIDQNDADRQNYDSGLNDLQKLRPRRESSKQIRIQNKMFEDIKMQIEEDGQNEEKQMVISDDNFELDIKPKVATSRASSFLNKVETLKKHRGLEADINQEEFDKMTKEKAKRSISQLMTKIQNQVEENQEIDIEIKAPTIAKGKSADLINNTMYIVKNLSQKHSSVSSTDNPAFSDAKNAQNEQSSSKPIEKGQQQKVIKSQPTIGPLAKNRKGVSREQFFKQIKESINMRKSKYISDEELKNSMKASKLEQLQEIRKKLEEKKRKQLMYQNGDLEDDDAENVIRDLEDDLAKHSGLSRADYHKQIIQEGLVNLDEYAEDDDKKKKKSADEKKQVTVAVENQGQKNKVKTIQRIEQVIAAKKAELQKQLRIQKAIMREEQAIEEESSGRHADDMIEEYEGDEAQKHQMDLENDEDHEADDQEAQHEKQEQEDDVKDQDSEESGSEEEQEENNPKIQEQASLINPQNQIKHEQDPSVRKELEDEGIIMPGNKKKPLISDKQPIIDFSKYIASAQNGQTPQSANLETISKQPTPKSLQLDEENLEFKEFRKLRKIAVIIQEKKKKREQQLKRAKQFFEQQAQLGSDNEQNDDNVKAINKKDDQSEEDGDHLDQQLQELIDNAVDINEADQQQAFKKYMEDVKEKDRQELQRILRGDFRRSNQDMPEMQEMQEDEKNRIERMQRMVEWMKQRQDDEKDLYAKDDSEDDDQMNYYYDYNGKKKKIQQKKNNSQEMADESPEEDNGEFQKKLQFYLMDTISPAKKQTQVEIDPELAMELPAMNKKNTISQLNQFARKPQDSQPSNLHQKIPQKYKETPSKISFYGSLLNLAAPKTQANTSSMPKMKKTSSHMSEVLNKNKAQKPSGFTPSTFKLPGLFNRLFKK